MWDVASGYGCDGNVVSYHIIISLHDYKMPCIPVVEEVEAYNNLVRSRIDVPPLLLCQRPVTHQSHIRGVAWSECMAPLGQLSPAQVDTGSFSACFFHSVKAE